jgi:CheY-like chemotaxis protein/two-component sensor histidine kinase
MGIQLLKTETADKEKRNWIYQNIERQSAQLTGLLDDLLDSTRISHGKLSLNKTTIPLSAAVERAVESCREIIAERGHELEITADSSEMMVEADPVRLEQIITNLLTNAAKYTPEGGRIRLQSRDRGNFVELRVEDSGVGISSADLDEIFKAFTQVGTPGEGLGIGLTLVRQLVELHGGSIQAESEGIGKGSTFCVTLPTAATGSKQNKQTTEDRSARPSVRVLIVDDNEPAGLMLQMLLQERGHSVQLALTGESGIEAALRWHPQLILLDLGLPDISGYEVAERLRKSGSDTLIAALSGYGRESAKNDQLIRGRFDAHLTKPATIAQIEGLLQPERQKLAADPSG